MDFLVYFVLFLISIGVGILGVVGGFGGGVFLFPILILCGFPIEVAAANSLISLFLPSLLASIYNHKRGEINYKLGIGLEIPTAIGAIVGANLTILLPSELLHVIFGFLALLMAFLMIKRLQTNEVIIERKSSWFNRLLKIGPKLNYKNGQHSDSIGLLVLILTGGVSGLLAGMFGVGAGWIKTPLMIVGFGVLSNIASATATFMIIITSAVGGYVHFLHGNIDVVFIPLTLGLLIGAEIGCKIRDRINVRIITYVVIISLILIAFTMFGILWI
ncbi:MAG: sulfite exporter TauE/SafE family protein [Candidatus Hodarchaeales archaeon]